MKPVSELTNEELKAELSSFGFMAGPITGTTRSILQKKLESFRNGSETANAPALKAKDNKMDSPCFNPNISSALNDADTSSNSFKTSFVDSTAVKNRTPTPPRKQTASTRIPLRQQAISGVAEPGSGRIVQSGGPFGHSSTSSASGGSIRYSRSSFGTGRIEALLEPTLDKKTMRKRTTTQSLHAFCHNQLALHRMKLEHMLAWGFFSRPLGTSTPCSDTGNKYVGYASNKYKRHSPPSFDSGGARFFDPKKISPDTSRWISHALVAFFAILFFTYVAKAHPEVISNGISATAGFAATTFHFLYNYAILPIVVVLIVGLFVVGVYKLADYRNRQKAEESRKLMLLVERITDIIYESGSSGVAEPHVRDMIMPPTKRSEADAKRWQEAALFINNEDSRIRTEIRLIDGTECNVWIWVGAGKQRWQGTAVLEGSPMARIPEQALTRCLKLRGISFSTNNAERDSIRRELLGKLRPILPKHIGFVSGTESVVYIMLKNLSDAKDAFMAFHSHWFNGNLLTAKYVRDQRYLERFPDADE
uniref:LEM domain-containing protein n=1 Tax=Globodera rostochiensis TaxID=31243 RepID=A0A914I975_GLORO